MLEFATRFAQHLLDVDLVDLRSAAGFVARFLGCFLLLVAAGGRAGRFVFLSPTFATATTCAAHDLAQVDLAQHLGTSERVLVGANRTGGHFVRLGVCSFRSIIAFGRRVGGHFCLGDGVGRRGGLSSRRFGSGLGCGGFFGLGLRQSGGGFGSGFLLRFDAGLCLGVEFGLGRGFGGSFGSGFFLGFALGFDAFEALHFFASSAFGVLFGLPFGFESGLFVRLLLIDARLPDAGYLIFVCRILGQQGEVGFLVRDLPVGTCFGVRILVAFLIEKRDDRIDADVQVFRYAEERLLFEVAHAM